MKIKLFLLVPLFSVILLAGFVQAVRADSVTSEVHLVNEHGVGQSIGTVVFTDSSNGLEIIPKLHSLPPGEHGFHIHEHDSCKHKMKEGKEVPGLAAGGHYDPENTGKHEGPLGNGHKGDLPVLVVRADGTTSNEKLFAPRLKVSELKGRSIMIHAGGDNYSDKPLPLGGGGPRIACGVIPK